MALPSPSPQYDAGNEAITRSQIELRLNQSRKAGDLEINPNERFIMTSPNGTKWVMGVSDAGATTWTAL